MTLRLSGSCPLFNLQNCSPVEDESIARGYFDLLRQRKFDPIALDLDTSVANLSLRNTLAEKMATVPAKKNALRGRRIKLRETETVRRLQFRRIPSFSQENGGADETRTRDLLRDRQAF
jgi:hypothetical protein